MPGATVRRVALAAYALGLVLYVALRGIPAGRLEVAFAILLLLSISVLGQGRAAWWQMVRDWVPFEAVLLAYDYSRGYASPYSHAQVVARHFPVDGVRNALGMPVHVTYPIRVDLWLGEHLGMSGMPTAWVQTHLYDRHDHPWYAAVVSLVYCSHFVVMPAVAVCLWLTHRERFRAFMRMVVTLAVAGVATYFLVPTAPPWLASRDGLYPGPRVHRPIAQGFDEIGLHPVGGALERAQYFVNPVAAMPSLHMAVATLVAGFFWPGTQWWQRVLLASYPVAMGFTLVYGGEHYVADEIAGVGYALVVLAGWRYLRARRTVLETVVEEPPVPVPQAG